jgi:hypothetical protein
LYFYFIYFNPFLFKISGIEELNKNDIREPRIVVIANDNKKDSILIVQNQTIINTFEKEESFTNILLYLYAFYFLLNIPYPEKFKIVFGFFHEALKIDQAVYFAKNKTLTYLQTISKLD